MAKKDKKIALDKYLYLANMTIFNRASQNLELLAGYYEHMEGMPPADVIYMLEDTVRELTVVLYNFKKIAQTLEELQNDYD